MLFILNSSTLVSVPLITFSFISVGIFPGTTAAPVASRNSRYAGAQSSAEEPDIMNDSPVTPGLMARSEVAGPPGHGAANPVLAPPPEFEDNSTAGSAEPSKLSPLSPALTPLGKFNMFTVIHFHSIHNSPCIVAVIVFLFWASM